MFRQSRMIMGTSVEITVSQTDAPRAEEAMAEAFREVERIDLLMSHYREGSEVSQITRNAGERETGFPRRLWRSSNGPFIFPASQRAPLISPLAPSSGCGISGKERLQKGEACKRA